MGKVPKTYGKKGRVAAKRPVLPLTDEDSIHLHDDTFDAVAGNNRRSGRILPRTNSDFAALTVPAGVNLSSESSTTPSFANRKKSKPKRKTFKLRRKKISHSSSAKEGSSVMDHQLKLASFQDDRPIADLMNENKSRWLQILSYEDYANSRDASKKKRFDSPDPKERMEKETLSFLVRNTLEKPHACSTPLKAFGGALPGKCLSAAESIGLDPAESKDQTDDVSAFTPISKKKSSILRCADRSENPITPYRNRSISFNVDPPEKKINSGRRLENQSRDIFETSHDNTSLSSCPSPININACNLKRSREGDFNTGEISNQKFEVGDLNLHTRIDENISLGDIKMSADKIAPARTDEKKCDSLDLPGVSSDCERILGSSAEEFRKLEDPADRRSSSLAPRSDRSVGEESPVPEEIFEELKNRVEKQLTYDNYFNSSRTVSSEGASEDELAASEEDCSPETPPRRSARLQRKSELKTAFDANNSFVSLPGKAFERSLSILRQIRKGDLSTVSEANLHKGRRYSLSVQSVLDLQNKRDYACFSSAPRRSTVGIIAEEVEEELEEDEKLDGFSSACDDPGIELSLSLSISRLSVDGAGPTLRDVVLRKCDQTRFLSFDECYPHDKLVNCLKIGEGVYGEVFLYKNVNDPGKPIVMKVIPVEGNLPVNGERQKKFQEVLSEIVIAKELTGLRHGALDRTSGFIKLNAIKCVQGRYPERLLDLWDLYDESKGSENDRPEFDDKQLYVVLEFENGGKNLEHFQFINAEQSFAIFSQIAFALAVAEEALQFEHRDLHIGNILISYTDEKYADFILRGSHHSIPTTGVSANIIDFTLSRATLPRAGRTVYNDLAEDEDLFNASGDYQFEIYRLMRIHNRNSWQEFEPFTNILWLHYLLTKLIECSAYEKPKTKCHASYMKKLKEMRDEILHYDSCTDYVLKDKCNR